MIAKRKVEHLSEENILINTTILRQLRAPATIQPIVPSKDETLQKLKAEVEMLVSSGKNYSYFSPEELFEEQLLKEFSHEPAAPPMVHAAVVKIRSRDPLGFTSGKHHCMNYEALAEARDVVRTLVDEDNRRKAEIDRLEQEEKERKRQEKIRLAKEKKAKRRPWSKSPEKEEPKPPFGVTFNPSPLKNPTPPLLPPPQISILI